MRDKAEIAKKQLNEGRDPVEEKAAVDFSPKLFTSHTPCSLTALHRLKSQMNAGGRDRWIRHCCCNCVAYSTFFVFIDENVQLYMRFIMTTKTAIAAGLLCSTFMAFPALAQVETVGKARFDCTYKKKVKKVLGFDRKSLAGDLISEVTDGRRKKYALRAAEQALEAGYNYAYMEPLRYEDQRFRRKVDNVWGGKSWGSVRGEQMKILGCLALDDISAYEVMINNDTPKDAGEYGGALVDLREVIASFDDKPYSKTLAPQIAAEHFKGIGTRERIAVQYPIMAEALACKAKMRPSSLKNFTPMPSAQALERERQCLSGLRPKAQTAGLDFINFVRGDAADLGYHINKPLQPSTPKTLATAQRQMADASLWGEGWFDETRGFGSVDGKVLQSSNGDTVVLGSNTLADTQLLDYAVFLSAKGALPRKYSVAALEDRTANYLEYFEKDRTRAVNAEIKAATKKAENFDLTFDQRDLSNMERDIRRTESRLAQARQPAVEDPNEFDELEASMKAFGQQDFDLEDMKNKMREARALGQASQIKRYEQQLAKERAELSRMKTTFASQMSEMQQQLNAVGSSASLEGTVKASERQTGERKGIYRAFENYGNVLVLKTSTQVQCRSEYLVCADKLQAYNTLGARLNVTGFTPYSTPVGYKPYKPN